MTNLEHARSIVEFVALGGWLGASWPNYKEFRAIPFASIDRVITLATELTAEEGWDLWAESAYNFQEASAEETPDPWEFLEEEWNE